MTLRHAIEDLLADLGSGADPRQVLAEHGFDDLPVEAFSSALVHFAESAPMDVADALAPLVTRLSPIPFAQGDLPPDEAADALADGGDVFDLLAELEAVAVGYDADPSDLDVGHVQGEEPDHGLDDGDGFDGGDTPTDDHGFDDGDHTFGAGETEAEATLHAGAAPSDFDDVFDELEEVTSEVGADDLAGLVEPTDHHEVDADDLHDLLPSEADEPGVDDDTDPGDLDFDLG
jgi:hypothetical protein